MNNQAEIMAAMKEEFYHPSEEYSPYPFWFWNDKLSEKEIAAQIKAFYEKGIRGFVIHPRLGLPENIGYLTETYFQFVEFAVKEATRRQMKVVLYDEAMYPSGSCHGQVVKKNPAFASQGLQMINRQAYDGTGSIIGSCNLNQQEYVFVQKPSMGTIRGIHFGEDDGETNAPRSADLLNQQAVASFIAHTHEVYYQHLGQYFGNTIIAMFTDEPNILGRCHIEPMIPWTEGFLEDFISQGGREEELCFLFDETVELGEHKKISKGKVLHEAPEEVKHARECYAKAIYQRLSRNYYGQIAEWCSQHQIALTGHPEKSTDIGYLQHFAIPCQDIVWRFVAPEENRAVVGEHSTMGKCSSDSARHRGKLRNGNECFGCCGAVDDPYKFTLGDMKWYLDWLFVRGVNMIFPHAFYYSVRGKRKEERPPEVGMHSAFWEDYRIISDYIKRMCGMLTGAVNQTSIAILAKPEMLSWKMAKPLWEHQIEFNYLEEELLPAGKLADGVFQIAQQQYSVILTDGTESEESRSFLKAFREQGGNVVTLTDADTEESFLEKVLAVIAPYMKTADWEPGLRKTHLVKGETSFVMLTNEGETDIDTEIRFTGEQPAEIWDAYRGTIVPIIERTRRYRLHLPKRNSVILRMVPVVPGAGK